MVLSHTKISEILLAMHGQALVALSIRIPADLSVALPRASTERRIQGFKPFRQQEMVVNMRSNRMPCAASRSRFGDHTSLVP